ncbi:hypothetical protein ACIQNU_03290 [Streptomyces sp. NPDC091292]|uniref:hypothetical protein n=1 Tax=Streptomyces sp. NPDC091292 TaxID=3365991 RepID=UPI0038045FA2
MVTPQESTQVAVELERLRGTVATGFAEVKGSLAVLVERSDRQEQDMKQLREDTEKDVGEVVQRVAALERARWPLPSIAALTGVAALVVAVYPQITGR